MFIQFTFHSITPPEAPFCNSLDFKPVKTKGLKIAAQLQKGASGGVIEWKVN